MDGRRRFPGGTFGRTQSAGSLARTFGPAVALDATLLGADATRR